MARKGRERGTEKQHGEVNEIKGRGEERDTSERTE